MVEGRRSESLAPEVRVEGVDFFAPMVPIKMSLEVFLYRTFEAVVVFRREWTQGRE